MGGVGQASVRLNVARQVPSVSRRETRLEREQKGLKGYTPHLTGKYAKL